MIEKAVSNAGIYFIDMVYITGVTVASWTSVRDFLCGQHFIRLFYQTGLTVSENWYPIQFLSLWSAWSQLCIEPSDIDFSVRWHHAEYRKGCEDWYPWNCLHFGKFCEFSFLVLRSIIHTCRTELRRKKVDIPVWSWWWLIYHLYVRQLFVCFCSN